MSSDSHSASESSSRGGASYPVVLLKHTLPDGTFHYDWLFARDDPPTQRLVTFRTNVRPDELTQGESALIARIADHRTKYLAYQGPVTGNRGRVERVRSGRHVPIGPIDAASIDWREPVRLRIRWTNDEVAEAGGDDANTQEWEIRGTTAILLDTKPDLPV